MTGLPTCLTCGKSVSGYTMVMPFQFINGDRRVMAEEARLSCGCVIIGPQFDVQETNMNGPKAIVSIKDLSGTLVLAFFDTFEEV